MDVASDEEAADDDASGPQYGMGEFSMDAKPKGQAPVRKKVVAVDANNTQRNATLKKQLKKQRKQQEKDRRKYGENAYNPNVEY
jgi:hypothetical protein